MLWNNNRVFNYKIWDNDKIIVEDSSVTNVVTTYIGEAPNGALVTDQVWKIRRIVETTAGSVVTTTEWVPVITNSFGDSVYEAGGNCIRDDSGSNVYSSYTYSK